MPLMSYYGVRSNERLWCGRHSEMIASKEPFNDISVRRLPKGSPREVMARSRVLFFGVSAVCFYTFNKVILSHSKLGCLYFFNSRNDHKCYHLMCTNKVAGPTYHCWTLRDSNWQPSASSTSTSSSYQIRQGFCVRHLFCHFVEYTCSARNPCFWQPITARPVEPGFCRGERKQESHPVLSSPL
jgi:hypothetical protein